MRWFWLLIWAVELVAALIALPVGLVLVLTGDSDGWIVMLVAAGLLVFWGLQFLAFGRDPDPLL